MLEKKNRSLRPKQLTEVRDDYSNYRRRPLDLPKGCLVRSAIAAVLSVKEKGGIVIYVRSKAADFDILQESPSGACCIGIGTHCRRIVSPIGSAQAAKSGECTI